MSVCSLAFKASGFDVLMVIGNSGTFGDLRVMDIRGTLEIGCSYGYRFDVLGGGNSLYSIV